MSSVLLFDSDSPTNTAQERMFNVAPGEAFLVVAAGLAVGECVPIYVRVGSPGKSGIACHACGPDEDPDYLWSPLSRCGSKVEVCEDANEYIERIPGTYMVGPPTAAGVVVAGDVNIAGRKLGPTYLHVQPYCSGGGDGAGVVTPPCPPLAVRGLRPAW